MKLQTPVNEQAALCGTPLYCASEVRELDRIAIEEHAIPGIRLMSRAGRAALDALLLRWPDAAAIRVFCGTGNNGGDGFVLASLARQRGIEALVVQVGDERKITGDAALAKSDAIAAGVSIEPFDQSAALVEGGVIVDALLGTGLKGDVRAGYAAAINMINGAGAAVIAIDTPSGLCADTGAVLGSAVHADHTISFIGAKRGLLTGSAPAYTGTIELDDLAIPAAVYEGVPTQCFQLQLSELQKLLPARSRIAHKGHCGHALMVGGELGTGGALVMAAQSAARVGAGLVSAATRSDHLPALIATSPEIMAHGVAGGADLVELVGRASVFAIGPGLGRKAWAEQLMQVIDQADGPRILDADALNILAQAPDYMSLQREDWILTPHPGEAGRLLGSSAAAVQADRFGAIEELQRRYGGVIVLKGAGTLISGGDEVYVSSYGGPGMASGGMGDVLTGVIAGLCAQGLSPLAAACYAVCLHARAAEEAARDGERGTLATDLLPRLRRLVNECSQ